MKQRQAQFLQVIIEMKSNKTKRRKLVQRGMRNKKICTEYDHFSKRNAKAIKNLFFL